MSPALVRPAAVCVCDRMLAETYVRVENAFPLVGVGGIDSAETALAKIRAGACLVQPLQRARIPRFRLVGRIIAH